MKNYRILLFLSVFTFIFSCKEDKKATPIEPETVVVSDPLPSWNEGKTKNDILAFVKNVTTEGSSGFVPVENRIATFDNDGTLWSEQPAYFQLFFALDKIKLMAEDHPEWKSTEPFKSVLADDMEGIMKSGEKGLVQLMMTSHANTTAEEFEESVKNWMKTAKHPRFNQPYNTVVYQPMQELLDYLKAHGFKNFIVSGGGIDFMRAWAPETYGIPSNQIIGSSINAKFDYTDGNASIIKMPELDFNDDKAGKPVGIYQHIGKKPIFAAGNSDGDLQMLQYTDSNTYPSFQLYVHHTDAEREWAYDSESHIGQFNIGLDEAIAKGWTLVDMKNDWKTIFSFQE